MKTWRMTLNVVLGALLLVLPAAVIPSVTAPSAVAGPAKLVEVDWDGGTTTLNSGGDDSVAMGSFMSGSVVFPGDRSARTAIVKNVGPSDATARVELVSVAVVTPQEAVNIDLQDCVRLFIEADGEQYDATWRQALEASVDGTSWSISLHVPMGTAFPIVAGAYFPAEETGGRSDGRPSQQLSFAVRVTMTGDAPSPPPDIRTGGRVVHH